MADETNLADALRVPAVDLGAPGRLDPAYCSAFAMKALQLSVGEALNLASFSLEMGSAEFGAEETVMVVVSADKRTHAIAFFSLEARAGPSLAFTARAVFSMR